MLTLFLIHGTVTNWNDVKRRINHEDFNGVENAAFGEREPFIIYGPGEYEVKEVEKKKGKKAEAPCRSFGRGLQLVLGRKYQFKVS